MFEHCTPENAGTRFAREGAGINERVRQLRLWIADLQVSLASMEAELQELLAARGSRPGDGSDQPVLFETEEQLKLF
jgi:hypothetical protein